MRVFSLASIITALAATALAQDVSVMPEDEASVLPIITPTPTPSVINHNINCTVKYEEGGFECPEGEVMEADKECCRWSQLCGPLPKCTENYCCAEPEAPSPTPTASPEVVVTPTPTSSPAVNQEITCGVKESEGGFTCDNDEVLDTDKTCCRWSGDCGALDKCTKDFCCSEAPPVTPTPTSSPQVDVTPTPTSSPGVNHDITCAVKESEGGFTCDDDENLDADKECCRWSGDCGSLDKCTQDFCCTKEPVATPSPTSSPGTTETPAPTPTSTIPGSDYITCGIKDVESPLECEVLDEDKECCRYSWNCGNLHKCTPSYCCKETTPTPTPHPSPSNTPSYEPVDNYINCAVKKAEGGFKCTGEESIDADKECCRWSEMCGDLRKCTESYCCTETSPTPKPSPSAAPVDYTIKCKEKHGLTCSIGTELNEDKKCCEYPGACGNLRSCKSDYCCEQSGPQPPPDTEGACDCDGAVINKVCYSTLELAIKAAADGDTIYVGGDKEVDAPIEFTESVNFSGVLCNDKRAQIIATFNETDRAIFEAVNEEKQEVNFLYLAITSEGENYAAAFHSLGSVTNAPDQKITMNLTNVWIHDMHSQRPGVGIFIGSSHGLTVDDNCVFQGLNMSTSEEGMYAGGAAIALVYLPEDYEINIAGTFKDNSAFYPDASKHSGGGAVYLDYMEGDVMFTAAFHNNTANQGGAVNVQGVLGNLVVDGYYNENHAIDDGYGSRAGAFRILKIESTGEVLFNGSFIGNTAQGRGGVVATNIHVSGSKMTLDGIFQNNVASTVGGVWSMWSSTSLNGRVTLEGESIFEGNLAVQDDCASGIYDIAEEGEGSIDKLSEHEWFGRTITIN